MRHLLASLLCLFSCADIVGIGPLPTDDGGPGPGEGGVDAPSDGPGYDNGICTRTTTILTTNQFADHEIVANGIAYAGDSNENVVGCPLGAPCENDNTPLANVPLNESFEGFAVGSQLYFTVQGNPGANQGTLHAAALNGTSDKIVLANLAYPLWVAQSNDHVFWVDDHLEGSGGNDITPTTLHCLGCGGAGVDTAWVTGLNRSVDVLVDSANVYVLAGDGTPNGTDGLYACSLAKACAGAPRTIVTGLEDLTITAASVAGDGTNVYVGRQDLHQILKYPPSGSPVTVLSNVDAQAIAVDAAKNELYYSTASNDIVEMDLQTSVSTVLSHCGANVIDVLVLDATNVYALVPTSTITGIFAASRP